MCFISAIVNGQKRLEKQTTSEGKYMKSRLLADVEEWKNAAPLFCSQQFSDDIRQFTQWYTDGQDCFGCLPKPGERNDIERNTAHHYRDVLAEIRSQFFAVHGMELYAAMTNQWHEFMRVDDLMYQFAEKFPGLAPTKLDIQRDHSHLLAEKQGHELSQGLILAELLAIPRVG